MYITPTAYSGTLLSIAMPSANICQSYIEKKNGWFEPNALIPRQKDEYFGVLCLLSSV